MTNNPPKKKVKEKTKTNNKIPNQKKEKDKQKGSILSGETREKSASCVWH